MRQWSDSSSSNGSLGRAIIIIGWREPVALPEWGISQIKTKMDTGARTSAIHVDNIQELPGNRVRFDVIVAPATSRSKAYAVPVETHVVRVSKVRPSSGEQQARLVVSTIVQLGPVRQRIELSLVSRHNMLCRMLLGRSALKGHFLIDAAHPQLLNVKTSKRKRRVSP